MSDNLETGVANSEIESRVLEKICSKLLIQEIDGASPLRNIIRQIVKEEVEQQLKDLNNGKCYSGADSSSGSRNLELKFSCNVSETIWTAEYIKGEGNNSILVTLFDSGKVVKFEPVASAKVEIVILEGSFNSDAWTTEEFNQNIIKEMNGKNILKGNAVLELKDGIGALGDLSILHNRTWKRKSMLRLGARCMGSFPNIKVKEAITKTFTMEDKRMKGSRKGAKLLSLKDKVWCLKNIGQRGHVVDRLTKEGIESVEDFLKLYFLRREDLQRILGHGWTEMKMNATIDHALKCKGSMALKQDALSSVKSPFDNKEVVWDDTVPPLVSPTCASSKGPFSSSSPMMGENVGAEAVVRSVVSKVGHDPTNTTTTAGEIFFSYEHGNVICNLENDPNNIFQQDALSHVKGVVWDDNVLPLVSPTCASSNGPFSSSSPMMGENVGAEAVVRSVVSKVGHDPTNTTTTAGEIFFSYEHGNVICNLENDPNNIFQQDALSHVKGVVWDDTVLPLVSPTCASSNGPFSSSSPMMGENVGAEAVVRSVVSKVGHDPTNTTTTAGEIFFSYEHGNVICNLENDPNNIFQQDALSHVKGVVWDDTVPPLVSPTCASSNGPFSSSSPMMGENVGAEAVVGSPFVRSVVSIVGHDPTNTTTTAGEIFFSYEHGNVICNLENDPNNIFQQDALSHVKGVVWDDTVSPLVSPTCASSSNGPFSPMVDGNIVAEAVLGSAIVGSEVSYGHDPTTTAGEIIFTNEHWDAIGDEGKNMDEFYWNDDNMLFRAPSFNYMVQPLWQFDDSPNNLCLAKD